MCSGGFGKKQNNREPIEKQTIYVNRMDDDDVFIHIIFKNCYRT
jgi:hypothetical protein